MKWLIVVLTCLLLFVRVVAAKEYLKDWQSVDSPADATEIITVPRYPKAGRIFEIRRTYLTERSDRWNRRTPKEGYKEILKVVDDKGTLVFWRGGVEIHRIELGPCFSFAKMDGNHDFARQGFPAFFTAPPDCKVWQGRRWHQTYRTLVIGWFNPCVYETKRAATVFEIGGSRGAHAANPTAMTIGKVLAAGLRTADIMQPGMRALSTAQMGEAVVAELEGLAA